MSSKKPASAKRANLPRAGVPTASASQKSARLGLRATPIQEAMLRRAAEASHKSLTDFILESACQTAEQTLLDQRLFMVSGSRYQALLDLLEQAPQESGGLSDLLARPVVGQRWHQGA